MPVDTAKAREIWAEYQRQHDISDRTGQAVGIDPVSERIGFGRKALDIARKTLGDRHPIVATTLNSLSHVLTAQGRYDEAAAALQDALAIARPALGIDHRTNALPAIGLRQIFVYDPNGVLLELNFPADPPQQ